MQLDALREHVARYLNRTLLCTDADYEAATAFLADHPTWGDRRSDILGMRVRRSRLNKSLQLQLRTNRVWFTVSWTVCATRKRAPRQNTRSPEIRRLHSAMRASIRPQILKWRRCQFGPKTCVACGASGRMQVDHIDPPFARIQDSFLQAATSVPTEFELKSCASAVPKFRQQDRMFMLSWNAHHAAQARYQFLCATCNRKKAAKSLHE